MKLRTINNLPIVDATKPVTITITPEDVKKGDNKNPSSCAVAMACMHAGYTEARVHLSRTYLRIGKKWLRFTTPQAIRTEIISFDRGASFQTGEYTMQPISAKERNMRGKAHTLEGPKRGRPDHKRAPSHVVRGVRAHGANK